MLIEIGELANDSLILPQVHFTPNEYYRHIGATSLDFRNPLRFNILEGLRGVNGETYESSVRSRIRIGPESVIVLMARSVPKSEFDKTLVDFELSNVVFEYSWNMYL